MVDGRLEQIELECELVELVDTDVCLCGRETVLGDLSRKEVEWEVTSSHTELEAVHDCQDQLAVGHRLVTDVLEWKFGLEVIESLELDAELLARFSPGIVKVRAKKANDTR